MKIQFQVNKSWITQNRIDRKTIALNRYKNGWQKLPTQEISEDSDFVYYEAESPGFSTFAITGEEIVLTTTTTIPIMPTTTLPVTTTIPEHKILLEIPIWIIVLIVILILVIGFIFILVHRRGRTKKEKQTIEKL